MGWWVNTAGSDLMKSSSGNRLAKRKDPYNQYNLLFCYFPRVFVFILI